MKQNESTRRPAGLTNIVILSDDGSKRGTASIDARLTAAAVKRAKARGLTFSGYVARLLGADLERRAVC